jgi:hypothetical protein
MPFLLPALIALSSDALVFWLRRLAPNAEHAITDDDKDQGTGTHQDFYYNVGYLAPLALTRIFILLLPLLFHSYTGTALKCTLFYQILYWGTLLTLLIHMLALCLMDPESLTAIFPTVSASISSRLTHRFLLQHLHELRRIWWMLSLSLMSNICHLIMFWHVRSSAPHDALFGTRRKQPSVYFALRSASIGAVNESGSYAHAHSHTNNEHEPPLVHAMNDFMIDLQGRLHRAKLDWSKRLDDFTSRLLMNEGRSTAVRRTGSLQNPLAPLTPFRVLLQLFAYEDVLENGKLDVVFDADDGASLTFYIPQLLSFLLHGALWCSPQLEEWILQKCRLNIHFAHRCYWFLKAWCLEVPVEIPASITPGISRQNSTDGLAPFLDEPSSPPSTKNANINTVDGGSVCSGRMGMERLPNARTSARSDKLLPEERAMIERLMMRVKECGEEPARILEHGNANADHDEEMNTNVGDDYDRAPETVTCDTTRKSSNGIDRGNVKSSLALDVANAVESGRIPVNPVTGLPSPKHVDSVSAEHKFGFSPLEQDKSRLSVNVHGNNGFYKNDGHGGGASDNFDKTPRFVDALIFLADGLFGVPRENRKEELKTQLRALECELLPSNAVYVPIGNSNHRVWRIVADESIAISTKERVPCIIYLEVIDYPVKRRKPRSWSLLPRKVQRSCSAEGIPERTTLVAETSTHSDRSSEYSLPDHTEQSEKAIVSEWRNAHRDPLRRVSLFDKMSTTVRDKVKVPLDNMKIKVQESIYQLRDRSVSEELRTLTLAETLVGGSNDIEAIASELQEFSTQDVERGRVVVEQAPTSGNSQCLSRVSSFGSISSMGQWGSPEPTERNIKATSKGDKSRATLTRARRRVDRDSDENGSVPLLYGSDHDEDQKDEIHRPQSRPSGGNSTLQLSSPATLKNKKRAPVVFRESWQTKEERIRKQSAYGSHPSWRLLPVMVKANDDLRQEQLASQIIYRMASVLARERVPVWLCPYEITAISDRGGVIEAIPDTISLDSLKRNDRNYTGLLDFFHSHFGEGTEDLADAKANFTESLAAYSIVCFLLQIKDRHNGNILLDSRGHLIHIDFGFFFLSSPGKNAGFESAPFKLTRDFVEVLGGPDSHLFRIFRDLCVRTFITLRRHCMEIILLVEMLKNGNEELDCFRGRPDDAISELRGRFRLDLNDRACTEYVYSLVDNSVENWRTDWYDRYQRYFVGVL